MTHSSFSTTRPSSSTPDLTLKLEPGPRQHNPDELQHGPGAVEQGLEFPENLCDSCRDLRFDDLINQGASSGLRKEIVLPSCWKFTERNSQGARDSLLHTLDSLKECPLCTLFAALVETNPSSGTSNALTLTLKFPKTQIESAISDPSFTRLNFLNVKYTHDEESLSESKSGELALLPHRLRESHEYKRIQSYGTVGVAAEYDSHASQTISRRLVRSNGADDVTIMTVKRWLATCEAEHYKCHESISGEYIGGQSPLPTRLVDVNPANEAPGSRFVRVVDTKGNRGRYLALSHSWRGVSSTTLTRATFEQLQSHGISSSDLPPSYRDAIILTRKLGFKYIWIDSLCIMQDDKNDWYRESQTMGTVYENAYCTIAATQVRSGEQGFLQRRRGNFDWNSTSVRLPCDPSDRERGYFYFTPPYDGNFGIRVEKSELNKRGWIVSERLLSRRIIHCTADQMYWECRSCILAEDGSVQKPTTEGLAGLARSLSDLKDPKTNSSNSGVWESKLSHQKFIDLWHRIVTTQSSCQFTENTDRLPALLGLAQRLQPLTDLIYYDGNWLHPCSKFPPRSLAWWACAPGKTRLPFTRAPSWSWAALEGEVYFELYKRQPLFKMMSIDVSKRFGLASFASLKLRGRLCAVSLDPPGHKILADDDSTLASFSDDDDTLASSAADSSTLRPDSPEQETPGNPDLPSSSAPLKRKPSAERGFDPPEERQTPFPSPVLGIGSHVAPSEGRGKQGSQWFRDRACCNTSRPDIADVSDPPRLVTPRTWTPTSFVAKPKGLGAKRHQDGKEPSPEPSIASSRTLEPVTFMTVPEGLQDKSQDGRKNPSSPTTAEAPTRERVSQIFLKNNLGGDDAPAIGHITFDCADDIPTNFECLLLYTDPSEYPIVLALKREELQGAKREYRRVGIGGFRREIMGAEFWKEETFSLI